MKLKTGTAKPQIVVLAGATAAGKSSLAIKLAQIPKMPSIEIICADSRQIYRGMDIGTDKISIKEQNGVPHHLLDIITLTPGFRLLILLRPPLNASKISALEKPFRLLLAEQACISAL